MSGDAVSIEPLFRQETVACLQRAAWRYGLKIGLLFGVLGAWIVFCVGIAIGAA